MTSLTELRALAEAAAAIQGKGLQHIGIMLEFHAGCFPQTVLAMIDVIEAGKAMHAVVPHCGDEACPDCGLLQAFDAALARLEQEQGR